MPPVSWEGEYVAFGASERAGEYCEGAPPYLDRYFAGLLESLNRQPPRDAVRYSFVAQDEIPRDSDTVVGTFFREYGVFSSLPVLEHELVHAALNANRSSHPLLGEGLAEYLGGDGDFPFREDTDLPLSDALLEVQEGRPLGAYYGVAGRFVSYLDGHYGREALLELEARVARYATTEELASAFLATTGVPFDAAASEFSQLEACPQKVYRDPSAACLGAEVISCGASTDVDNTVDLSCGSPDVLGVRDGEIWAYRVLTAPTPGTYGLYFAGTDESFEGYAELKQCAGGCDSLFVQTYLPWGLRPAEWFEITEPGEYLLKIAVKTPTETTVRFQFLGPDCDP